MTDCNIHVNSNIRKPPILSRKQRKVFIDVWPDGNSTVPTCKSGDKLSTLFSADGGSGVLFCTYNLLGAGKEKQIPEGKEEVSTYIQRVIAALECPGTRFMQILQWLLVSFIIFKCMNYQDSCGKTGCDRTRFAISSVCRSDGGS